MTFSSAHPSLARALAARGYSAPTAVQLAVLEADKAQRDLLVSAQTGSGKTVAFGLAFAPTLLGEAERLPQAAEPMALVIAPTRELAMQVHRELTWLYADAGARVVTCVGGMDGRAEARQLSFGAHIVVGTPGRLRDHLERHRLDLSKLQTIVLDEADEMLDLGFREDLEFILDATPENRQTLLFSATMPHGIETLAKRYQRDAVRIETLKRNEQHADIEYRAIRVAPNDIENAVVNVLRLHEVTAALVFCATRESVKRMHVRLAERGFSAVALSGELTQNERTHALQALRDGRARVLVATDVAARGLDLPDLALVIHADLPNDAETLLHRSGRTGRAGNKGLCTLIVPFNRRRKADALLASAKLKVTWAPAPTPDEIRAKDQERFLADSIFTDVATEEDLALARNLQSAKTADEIALALVRMHRAHLPAPEELAEDTGPPPRRGDFARNPRDRFERRGDHRPSDRKYAGDESRPPRERREPRPRREDNREMVWFRLNIGRDRNADPRWLLPLICRAGDVSKSEIGAIKIGDRDTRFEIVAEHADRFANAVATNKTKEGHISRVGAHSAEDFAAVTDAINALPAASRHDRHDGPKREPRLDFRSDARPDHHRPKGPWRDRPIEGHKARARGHSRDDRTNASDHTGARESRPYSGSKPESRPGARPDHHRTKAPWRDRDNAKGGGRPHRNSDAAKSHSQGAHKPRHASEDTGRPTSKYANKKKHRAHPPVKA
jgi:ATP-dependent RNA helicase DeaD